MADVSSRILINADDTVLVVVDCDREKVASASPSPEAVNGIVGRIGDILTAASALNVPTIATLLSPVDRPASPPLAILRDLPVFRRKVPNPWEFEPFRSAVASTKRNQLIVIGCCAEMGASFTALNALELGYAVYIVVDAIRFASQLEVDTGLLRMTQAGVVALTTLQLLSEWHR